MSKVTCEDRFQSLVDREIKQGIEKRYAGRNLRADVKAELYKNTQCFLEGELKASSTGENYVFDPLNAQEVEKSFILARTGLALALPSALWKATLKMKLEKHNGKDSHA